MSGTTDRLLNAFKKMAETGPILNKEKCHLIVKKEKIWQITEGQCRALYFTVGKRFIITHAFKKQGPKTPPKEKKRAIEMKREYLAQQDKADMFLCREEEFVYGEEF